MYELPIMLVLFTLCTLPHVPWLNLNTHDLVLFIQGQFERLVIVLYVLVVVVTVVVLADGIVEIY